MKAIWAKGLKEEKNITLAFSLDLGAKERFTMKLAAASLYRVYVDGEFVAFGPQRAAKGYARVENFSAEGKRLVVEVENIYVPTFWVIKQPPFFACEIETESGKKYIADDFCCQLLTDRLQKVQRYSYQRGFAETYKMGVDRTALYLGQGYDAQVLETEPATLPEILPSYVDKPKYNVHTKQTLVETGVVGMDENLPIWRDRAHWLVGTDLEGFLMDEWEDRLTDETSQFVYFPHTMSAANAKYRYKTVDFSRAITGFFEVKVKVKNAGSLYVIYDELLWHERGKGENYVAFDRNTTSNVCKWQFEKAGEYTVTTFEPYTCRYACIVYDEGIEAELSIRDYENPNADKMRFTCSDKRVEKIVEAARATLAQNAVDLLTDCPSRERAGWLSDSYFSSVAERIFTGENQVEKAFLDNYAKAKMEGLPEGMIPMCYPSDYLGSTYIPNWALWYIMEIDKYAKIYGVDDAVLNAKDTVFGILQFFTRYENEIGLLENLESWVFIEWSAANDADHIRGVNIPSNIEYAACLKVAGTLYNIPAFLEKADEINQNIKTLAFDGKFFVDNLIRNEEGKLVQSGLLTEVCQYYAFWFGCADKNEYADLYAELMNNLGTNRKEDYLPNVGKPNVMYGLYMRVDLLMRDGEREKVFDECIRLFQPMAERTGTLWEHNAICASCNHGFAAYATKWLIYALTGYDAINGGAAAEKGIGVDCEIALPLDGNGAYRYLSVKDNVVTVK